jgi:hypothetical protein
MRRIPILVVIAAALLCGCAVDAGGGESESTEKNEAAFDTSMFKFNVWVRDDGKDDSGGAQRAFTMLEFKDYRTSLIFPDKWSCPLTVSLPIRSRNVVITPQNAAEMTVLVAEAASSAVMHSMPKWPIPVLFCKRFAEKMVDVFKKVPGGPTGARVTSP